MSGYETGYDNVLSEKMNIFTPKIMGVLNVTPDSFSDGGSYVTTDQAVSRGLEMLQQGASIIDVGGESTRPGAIAVSAQEEIDRTASVIAGLVARMEVEGLSGSISIDTSKASVAREALKLGASIINDVSALRDSEMLPLAVETGATLCLMHMQGDPRTMQSNPRYNDVVKEVYSYLLTQASFCTAKGLPKDRIWLDPGIGFGKTVQHNLEILRNIDHFIRSGFPIVLGVSRKSFLGKIIGSEDAPAPIEDRLAGTLAVHCFAQSKGVQILRTHDVKEARIALQLTQLLT